MSPRQERAATAAVLASAAAVRLAFLLFLPYGDHGNASYLEPALELVRDGRYDSFATLHRLPGAPWFFALVMAVVGDRPWALVLAQHALGVGTVWLSMRAARQAFGPVAALATGCLLALHALFAYQECFLLSEAPAHFLLALSLLLVLRLRREGAAAPWLWAAAGAAAGLAGLTRGEMAVLGPLAAVFLLLPGAPRVRAGRWALLAGTWALIVGGWAARNWALFGYRGLTPESMTLALDTAWPLVRWDLPTQPLVKGILREQLERRLSAPQLDPRPTTIERLQREHGYSYLSAEVALGEVVREAVRTRPLEYLRLASPNFSLRPSAWLDEARQFEGVRLDRGPWAERDAVFWRALEGAQHWGWVVLFSACAGTILVLLRRSGLWEAGFALAVWGALWAVPLLFRPTASRIQAQVYIPMAILAGAAAARPGIRSRAPEGAKEAAWAGA